MTERVDSATRYMARFTQATIALQVQREAPTPTVHTVTHWTPSDRHGRIPCIGLDSGAIPGTRPDHASKWGPA